jgi:hypothetical protein
MALAGKINRVSEVIMDQLNWARRLLEESGYFVEMVQDQLVFEDQTLYGFISFPLTVRDLIDGWESVQDTFLKKYALSIRRGDLKSWNAYSVFLCAEKATEVERTILADLEENFRATRKIVKTHVLSQKDVKQALFPLLPIQHPVQLSAENLKERILERISLSPSQKEALFSDATSEELLTLVLEDN